MNTIQITKNKGSIQINNSDYTLTPYAGIVMLELSNNNNQTTIEVTTSGGLVQATMPEACPDVLNSIGGYPIVVSILDQIADETQETAHLKLQSVAGDVCTYVVSPD